MTKGRPVFDCAIKCLFVEDYPDLGLEPRGRILTLFVAATEINSKSESDDVIVHNRLEGSDNKFVHQARDSVVAARIYLNERFRLSPKKRFRIEFEIDSTGARFTGDSLGVAFAVGAIVAISRSTVFRDRLSIVPNVALSGALSTDGKLRMIDGQGLRLKIYRSFHSELKALVIPKEHVTDAENYLRQLEEKEPRRGLEIVGADTLEAVASDPRVITSRQDHYVKYLIRKVWQARRLAGEAFLLVALLAVAIAYALYLFDNQPSKLVATRDGFETQNRYSRTIWSKKFPECDSLNEAYFSGCWRVADIGGNTGNEVLFGPSTVGACKLSGWWFAYDHSGKLLFSCNGRICGKYPTDSIAEDQPDYYEGPSLRIFDVNGEKIVTSAYNRIYPARGYIKCWSGKGEQLGEYLLSGTGDITATIDIDGDGTKELVGYAFWNRLNCMGVFIIPVHGAHGVSPPYWLDPGGMDLRNVERGNQIRFIAVPLSFDVGRFCSHAFMPGSVKLTQLSQNEYRLNSSEFSEGNAEYTVDYYLDRNFRCKEVKLSDNFRKKRQSLIEHGDIKNYPDNIYTGMLRDSVRYWLSPSDSTYTTEGQLRALGK